MQETTWPDDLFHDIDRSGPVPLYFQVATRLEDAIRTGLLPPGARLENELAIAGRLGLSRPTVRRAIQSLVDKGLLVRRRGIGTVVVPNQVRRSVALTSLFDDLDRSGAHPATRVLWSAVEEPPEDVAARLGMRSGQTALHLRRLRSADGAPIAIMENWIPAPLDDLDVDELERRGLYESLRTRGVDIRVADQRIGARNARRDEYRLLELSGGDAVLTIERVSFDGDGRAVEFARHCYRPDRYAYDTTLVAR